MGGLAAVISWQSSEQSLLREQCQHMLAEISHRAAAGFSSPVPTDGFSRFFGAQAALADARPARNPQVEAPNVAAPAVSIAADMRLDNRLEFALRLGVKDTAAHCDAELVRLGYLRYGKAVLEYIEGDYSFVIWNSETAEVFAARDPFGARPLCYATFEQRMYFCSEPKQLLSLVGFPLTADSRTIGQFIFNSVRSLEETFFAAISRLQPGYFLSQQRQQRQLQRFWLPSLELLDCAAESDYVEQFRQLFFQAVTRRMPNDSAVGADLSGGQDSSSIVVAAQAALRRGESRARSLTALTAVFPGLSCDEQHYSDAVCRHANVTARRYDPYLVSLSAALTDNFYWTDTPRVDLQQGFFLSTAKIAAELGIAVHLMGVGGDEVLEEPYYLEDLLRQGNFLQALRESSARSVAKAALRVGVIEPLRPLRRLQQRLQLGAGRCGDRRLAEDVWANQEFLTDFEARQRPEWYPQRQYRSKTQQIHFEYPQYPYYFWNFEMAEALAAKAGYGVAYPFLDRALIEFLLRVPSGQPKGRGEWKFWSRAALGELLPTEVSARRDKATFNDFSAKVLKRELAEILPELCSVDQWSATEWIDPVGLVKLSREFLATPENFSLLEFSSLWSAACLELWARGLTARYRQGVGVVVVPFIANSSLQNVGG